MFLTCCLPSSFRFPCFLSNALALSSLYQFPPMCEYPCVLSVCLSVCLFVCLPACLPACLSACLPDCLSCLPALLPACLSALLHACLPACLLACLPVSQSFCLSTDTATATLCHPRLQLRTRSCLLRTWPRLSRQGALSAACQTMTDGQITAIII